mgnify:CR=1 FL=1
MKIVDLDEYFGIHKSLNRTVPLRDLNPWEYFYCPDTDNVYQRLMILVDNSFKILDVKTREITYLDHRAGIIRLETELHIKKVIK